jgi:uncharacterized protein YyaL (SSP411 family)
VGAHAEAALAQPFAHGALLRTAGVLARAPRQLLVVTEDPAGALTAAARGVHADVVAAVTPDQCARWVEAGFSLFDGKVMHDGRPTAHDCQDFACRLPVTEPADLTDR